ncbi:formate dehydrogenase accessory sulfurtransferase FdhD [Desulfogranum marinum]|uniref:formate dehydrogenase accessory sulfurtransferase FdhD n=1 Tax=Desulfogranum marinum TaxID=453220 RepID=UPI0029C95F7B|nr:formate dehydrogenase accessory sulfurtransferase FdhD [Desulfogranum marinum]
MHTNQAHEIVRVRQGRSEQLQRHTVSEYPLRLRVNDRELATLVCSPHQLNFLLFGFFRLQGFIESLDDISSFEVCDKYGLADVHLKGELPERLQPTLTSGCGTGIAYNLPTQLLGKNRQRPRNYNTRALLQLMNELNDLTEHYRSHGGIHSAAIGDSDGTLILHAEDIGRHNTFDRVAGEALVRKIDLHDKMLVTSGRVSTEMVAKAAKLGVGLVASRTSPTDKAVELCEQAGITLVGYVRGKNMDIYAHPEQLNVTGTGDRISGVTGVILAGGESRRMGSNKSLLPLAGARFIDQVYRRMAGLFDEVIIVTNTPDLYKEIPCRKVPDIYYAQGALAGLHSGLAHAKCEKIFVVACDMPFISAAVVKEICAHADQGDLVIPFSSNGHEPLHALYSKSCLPAMEEVLDAGLKRIITFFEKVKQVELPASKIRQYDPEEKSFKNINTPEDYFRLRATVVATEQPQLQLKQGNN